MCMYLLSFLFLPEVADEEDVEEDDHEQEREDGHDQSQRSWRRK